MSSVEDMQSLSKECTFPFAWGLINVDVQISLISNLGLRVDCKFYLCLLYSTLNLIKELVSIIFCVKQVDKIFNTDVEEDYDHRKKRIGKANKGQLIE